MPASSLAETCRPDRARTSSINPPGDGDKKARSPGRSRSKPLKPLRAGMPGCPGELVVTTLVWFLFFHARLRVHRAPGIPHALVWAESFLGTTRAKRAAGMRTRIQLATSLR